ncbi:MAG: hypothetical protein H7Z42_12980 [Roseiflexaceae bacterium]|nr:hypothetical protein [Roseiflexaceae bacterium]
MTGADKTYTREFAIAMVLYCIAVVVVVLTLPALGDSPLRFVLALLPVLPGLLGVWAFMRFLARMDELQQRIQLSALAFSFAVSGLLTFAYGFLEIAGAPRIPAIWVFPIMIMLWGLGLGFASRRYS